MIQLTPPTAFIFDMDDLLIRSGHLWSAAAAKLLNRLGSQWTPDMEDHYKGMNAFGVTATLHRLLQLEIQLEEFTAQYRDELWRQFESNIEPMPGAVQLLKRLRGTKPMALASGSPLRVIRTVTERLEIADCFNAILTSENVARGKPHPDVFLAAAEKLDVAAPGCIVFEDSLVGVQAACAAGMRCYAVPSGRHEEIAALATQTFGSLADIPDSALGITR